MCRAFGARFVDVDFSPALRPGLPSNSSQNSWFCKLLLKQVTTPVFGGGGPLFTTGASRLISLSIRLKYKAANEFQTSLEEAAQW